MRRKGVVFLLKVIGCEHENKNAFYSDLVENYYCIVSVLAHDGSVTSYAGVKWYTVCE